MTANGLKPRFKNPFDLTVAQALSAGGGNSRQSLHKKQQQLREVRIDGKRLIKITPGTQSRYVCALYEINYELLIPQDVMIPEFDADASKIIDTPVDAPSRKVDTVVDAPSKIIDHPKILDQRREENIHQSTVNKVTTGNGGDSDSENGGGVLAKGKKPEDEAQTVLNELRYHRVNDPVRSEIVAKYETRYIYRQILQIRKDFLNGIVFSNPGGALVARIRSGHETKDYPE